MQKIHCNFRKAFCCLAFLALLIELSLVSSAQAADVNVFFQGRLYYVTKDVASNLGLTIGDPVFGFFRYDATAIGSPASFITSLSELCGTT